MATVKDHYSTTLSAVYTWMNGGFDAAACRNAEFFERHGLVPRRSGRAVDLGAGSGFQSVPLAEAGYAVTAIDFDTGLLRELTERSEGLSIAVVDADLTQVRGIVEDGAELVVCMTDTVLHLESPAAVSELFRDVYEILDASGRFIVTFRNLTHELGGADRFIPVKSDASRILTCFLEFEPDRVKVHDLVYQLENGQWTFHKSWYSKLRLSPQWIEDALGQAGFTAVELEDVNGFVTAIAKKTD